MSSIKQELMTILGYEFVQINETVIWNILTLYFGIPECNPKNVLLRLANQCASELCINVSFDFADLRYARSEKKWLSFLSIVVTYLQANSRTGDGCLEESSKRKQEHAEQVNKLTELTRQVKVASASRERKQNELTAYRQSIAQVGDEEEQLVSSLGSTNQQLQKIQAQLSQGQSELTTLKSDIASATDKIAQLEGSVVEGNADQLQAQDQLLVNNLHAIESENHKLHQIYNSFLDRSQQFGEEIGRLDSEFKPLLDVISQMNAKIDAGKVLVKKKQIAHDSLTSQLNKVKREVESNQLILADNESECMRKKMLAHQSKQTIQANQEVLVNYLASVEASIDAASLERKALRCKIASRRERLAEEVAAVKKANDKLVAVQQIKRNIAELHKELDRHNRRQC